MDTNQSIKKQDKVVKMDTSSDYIPESNEVVKMDTSPG